MLKKLSLVLSVLATLGFALAISAPADAKEQQKNKVVRTNVTRTNVVRTNRTNLNRTNLNRSNVKSSKYKMGQKVNGHIWFGHSHHRWHGRWYDYGVGPCWINIDDEWFWNELACPL